MIVWHSQCHLPPWTGLLAGAARCLPAGSAGLPPTADLDLGVCLQANGRTVRSLAYVLSMYPGVKMYFVAPDEVRCNGFAGDACNHALHGLAAWGTWRQLSHSPGGLVSSSPLAVCLRR